MSNSKLPLSIGLPVFNGERFLKEAIDSLLTQTFEDFELVISDNASTDKTEEICREYASNDNRLRYYRHVQNIGAARNFNRVFELSKGKYFKWAAHDDLCAPELLRQCVEVLDRDSSVILCYSRTKAINEQGEVIRVYPAKPDAGASKPQDRFYEFACIPHPCVAIWGVMRAGVLKKTRLIGNYTASDRPLLTELSLLGKFYEIPQYLFFYRNHPQQSWRAHSTWRSQQVWYDPARSDKLTFPHWRLLWEHIFSIRRVSLTWRDCMWCYLYMGWWTRKQWKNLVRDLVLL